MILISATKTHPFGNWLLMLLVHVVRFGRLEDATAYAEDDVAAPKEFVILTQSFRVVGRRKRSSLDMAPLQDDMNLATRIPRPQKTCPSARKGKQHMLPLVLKICF